MTSCRRNIIVLLSITLCAIAIMCFVSPIPQDQAYYDFADIRTMLGIPNALDVLSNLPFVFVGVAGLVLIGKRFFTKTATPVDPMYFVFFIGVLLTGFGSGYFHIEPNNATLVWDRLPMTIAFMGLFSAIIAERISLNVGRALCIPLLAFGIFSIWYWQWTEIHGVGDLRPYALVQFLPMVLIPLILWLFSPRYTRGYDFIITIGWYGLSKLSEALDKVIFSVGSVVSGHSLKHIFAAIGTYWILRMVFKREEITGS
jgi:hypothetical protein